ncbi:hypothetical protein BDW22DRAFT_600434 [Trametopsis cervina]|nr:hypothetical protein BDW22DRAFT_600434 [Trametopsis cervina]
MARCCPQLCPCTASPLITVDVVPPSPVATLFLLYISPDNSIRGGPDSLAHQFITLPPSWHFTLFTDGCDIHNSHVPTCSETSYWTRRSIGSASFRKVLLPRHATAPVRRDKAIPQLCSDPVLDKINILSDCRHHYDQTHRSFEGSRRHHLSH